MPVSPRSTSEAQAAANRIQPGDEAVHGWYRFVLSFPPHLVRDYLDRFGVDTRHTVLDPFCGTGTTLVECKKHGIATIGIEANPMACFASTVKANWDIDPDGLLGAASEVGEAAEDRLRSEGLDPRQLFSEMVQEPKRLRELPPESSRLLLKGSIGPLPLHRTLVLLGAIKAHGDKRYEAHQLLALADALPTSIGNLRFGPEVGVGRPKLDSPVLASWYAGVRRMAGDLSAVRNYANTPATVIRGDSRELSRLLPRASVHAVITSPPYPNEKDYTRIMRLESVVLGFLTTRAELQALKRGLLRSNTRNVYKGDDDDLWVDEHPEVRRIADEIERRRVQLGKTSGFERLYPSVTKLYFGGMKRHLADLRASLRPGARLAYVVGDQASYLRVMIRTGRLIAEIAESLGYEVLSIDLFRTRLATITREQLREEVVVLRWPGQGRGRRPTPELTR